VLDNNNTRKHTPPSQHFVHFDLAGKMSDSKPKGVSLRKKRDKRQKDSPLTISAPRQISAPMPTGIAASSVSSSGRPSVESNRSGRRLDTPRERPQRADKTADLVKRRYSQRITQMPSDFGNGAPMPEMPQIPSQFREAPPSRDGRPPGSSDGRAVKIDMRALQDPNLRSDQCGCMNWN
jgi:exocyst complex component 8